MDLYYFVAAKWKMGNLVKNSVATAPGNIPVDLAKKLYFIYTPTRICGEFL